MRRSACLSLLTLLGLVLVAGTYDAQEPGAHPPIAVQRIADNLHVLASGTTTGGNTAVFITANLAADVLNRALNPKLKAASE